MNHKSVLWSKKREVKIEKFVFSALSRRKIIEIKFLDSDYELETQKMEKGTEWGKRGEPEAKWAVVGAAPILIGI